MIWFRSSPGSRWRPFALCFHGADITAKTSRRLTRKPQTRRPQTRSRWMPRQPSSRRATRRKSIRKPGPRSRQTSSLPTQHIHQQCQGLFTAFHPQIRHGNRGVSRRSSRSTIAQKRFNLERAFVLYLVIRVRRVFDGALLENKR